MCENDGQTTASITALPVRYSRSVVWRNPDGLHCRVAAAVVRMSFRFAAEIFLRKGGKEVKGTSIIGLLMLGVAPGDELLVRAEGPDAMQAVDAMAQMVAACEPAPTEPPVAILPGHRAAHNP